MKSLNELFLESIYEMCGGKEVLTSTLKAIDEVGYSGKFCKMIDRKKYQHLDDNKRYKITLGVAEEIKDA